LNRNPKADRIDTTGEWRYSSKDLKGDIMPTYVMLTNLTTWGRKSVKERPERIKEVNKEVEAMGVRIIGQYAVLGPYDFVNILDAPDDAAISRVAVELGSRGTLETMTMSAITLNEFVANLNKNKKA
jgi:uncharacterized protein with GYD domain